MCVWLQSWFSQHVIELSLHTGNWQEHDKIWLITQARRPKSIRIGSTLLYMRRPVSHSPKHQHTSTSTQQHNNEISHQYSSSTFSTGDGTINKYMLLSNINIHWIVMATKLPVTRGLPQSRPQFCLPSPAQSHRHGWSANKQTIHASYLAAHLCNLQQSSIYLTFHKQHI